MTSWVRVGIVRVDRLLSLDELFTDHVLSMPSVSFVLVDPSSLRIALTLYSEA